MTTTEPRCRRCFVRLSWHRGADHRFIEASAGDLILHRLEQEEAT